MTDVGSHPALILWQVRPWRQRTPRQRIDVVFMILRLRMIDKGDAMVGEVGGLPHWRGESNVGLWLTMSEN